MSTTTHSCSHVQHLIPQSCLRLSDPEDCTESFGTAVPCRFLATKPARIRQSRALHSCWGCIKASKSQRQSRAVDTAAAGRP